MSTPVAVLLLLSSLSLDRPAVAQDPQEIPSCDQNRDYQVLDFWVGEWDVFVGDRLVGHNLIEKTLAGCAVIEHWTAAGGGQGRSLFYYAPHFDGWRQVWVTENVAAPGGLKEKREVAAPAEGSVRFQGDIRLPDGSTYLDHTTLTPLANGEVRQHIEVSGDQGTSWRTTFDAIYRRAAETR